VLIPSLASPAWPQAGEVFLFYHAAIGMSVTVNGVKEIMLAFDRLPQAARAAAGNGVYRATVLVRGTAVEYAPVSPTDVQAARDTRKTRKNTSKRKKPTATSRRKPGALERSISMSVITAPRIEGSVFVAENAECRSAKGYNYAKRIHDEKGKSWQNRGPGTINKGPKADHKFIERALKDKDKEIDAIMAEEMQKVNL
jgi:hypothetical protein